jgi:hypothetical protein
MMKINCSLLSQNLNVYFRLFDYVNIYWENSLTEQYLVAYALDKL